MPAKKTKKLKETFALEAPDAATVLLAGDFTNWEMAPIEMKRDTSGRWATSVPLDPGAYQYRFVVDGQWTDDPTAPAHATNPFGSQNCVRTVSAA